MRAPQSPHGCASAFKKRQDAVRQSGEPADRKSMPCPALPKALALGLARGIDTPGQVFMRRSSRSTFGRSVERLFSSLFSSERPNPDFNELRTGHQERPGVARTPNARCCVQPRPWIEKGIHVRSFRPPGTGQSNLPHRAALCHHRFQRFASWHEHCRALWHLLLVIVSCHRDEGVVRNHTLSPAIHMA